MKKNRFYAIARVCVMPLLWLIFPHRVFGLENIPSTGPVMLCSNHVSLIDPVFLGCSLKRQIRFISKKELFSVKILGSFLRALGMFPVDRGGTDMTAMRTSLSILREGGVLGIFPQGHRYRQDENRKMESGAALMALRARVPVIPIHISPVKAFRRTTIRIGAPLELSDIGRIDGAAVTEFTNRLSGAIWKD